MNTGTAFITGLALPSARSVQISRANVCGDRVGATCKKMVTRRTNGIVMLKEDKKGDVPEIPQGFTRFSENFNGRAAMIGFTLAVVTELITGKGIVEQVSALFKNLF